MAGFYNLIVFGDINSWTVQEVASNLRPAGYAIRPVHKFHLSLTESRMEWVEPFVTELLEGAATRGRAWFDRHKQADYPIAPGSERKVCFGFLNCDYPPTMDWVEGIIVKRLTEDMTGTHKRLIGCVAPATLWRNGACKKWSDNLSHNLPHVLIDEEGIPRY